jgi:hypothetical protein
VFFKSDETHVRSMTIDASGNAIVGTEPGGLVMRVSPAGEGFVLYQTPKREVTAVAVARDGAIYAAAVGAKQAALPAPAPAPAMPAGCGNRHGECPRNPATAVARPPAQPPVSLGAPAGVSGGSEVYRIEPNGNPRRIWSHAQDVVYAIAFDGAGRAVLGTGNKGNVYRIESPTLWTALLTVPATQVTAFQAGREGRLYAATGNAGKVYEIGPGLEREGTIESDVFDAGMYSLWGRLSFEANLNGGKVAIATRSGNLDQPQKNWSAFSRPSPRRRAAAWVRRRRGSCSGKPRSPPIARGIRRNWNRWTWRTCRRMSSRASKRSR